MPKFQSAESADPNAKPEGDGEQQEKPFKDKVDDRVLSLRVKAVRANDTRLDTVAKAMPSMVDEFTQAEEAKKRNKEGQ